MGLFRRRKKSVFTEEEKMKKLNEDSNDHHKKMWKKKWKKVDIFSALPKESSRDKDSDSSNIQEHEPSAKSSLGGATHLENVDDSRGVLPKAEESVVLPTENSIINERIKQYAWLSRLKPETRKMINPDIIAEAEYWAEQKKRAESEYASVNDLAKAQATPGKITAESILKIRYASGEITKKEFEEMKKDIEK